MATRARTGGCTATTTCVAASLIIATGPARAAMEDAFLQAEPVAAAPDGIAAEAAYDAMDNFGTDSSGNGTGNYQGGHFRLGYKLSPGWSLEAGYWRRHLTYGSDSANINSWQFAAYYGILKSPEHGRTLTLRLSAWGDYIGDGLSKSSVTRVNGVPFTNVSLAHPNDTQIQADLIYTGHPWANHALTGFISGGYSWVRAGDLQANTQQGNCRYAVRVGSDNIALGSLAEPCRVGPVTVTNANFRIDANQYGVQTGRDFNYGAAFVGVGGSWRWRYGGFGLTAAYHFQYLFRDLDDRLAAYGAPRVAFNQTVGLEFSYAPARHVEIFLRGQGFQNSLIGYVPTLYNPVTANRLDRPYGLASIGIRIFGF